MSHRLGQKFQHEEDSGPHELYDYEHEKIYTIVLIKYLYVIIERKILKLL